MINNKPCTLYFVLRNDFVLLKDKTSNHKIEDGVKEIFQIKNILFLNIFIHLNLFSINK